MTQLSLDILRPVLSPADVARRLGLAHLPTPEQEAVIGAPLRPGVVVAGAGSGKTETMAARVVWLVANGLVRPEQILGLTFTRKAAAELAHRIRRRLRQLAATAPDGTDPAAALAGEPTVSTYDAYAGRIVAEHGLRIGVEPSVRIIGDAVRWQLAHRAVSHYDGDMDSVEAAPSTVVRDLLGLADQLAGHLVEPERLVRFSTELDARIRALPAAIGQKTRGYMYSQVIEMLTRQAGRLQLLPLLESYQEIKRELEVVEFADQMRNAARLAERYAEVGELERQRYAVVLLDEYQDTSTAQARLLHALFAGHSVTAVGDPCQSIYGWRGASQGTLRQFRTMFAEPSGEPAALSTLRTSFRNSRRVLRVANVLAEPLRAHGVDVDELTAAPGAPEGSVVCALHETAGAELVDLVDRISALWTRTRSSGDPRDEGPSIAVLSRQRAPLEPLATALRSRGVPVEVAGLAGLLGVPEVADIVATLRVLADPTAGSSLMRLLTGARWRIGPADLAALGRWAGRLAAERRPIGPMPAGVDPGGADPDEVDERSIIDALDVVEQAPEDLFSTEGRRRLSVLAAELRILRARVSQPLPDLVADVERTIRLDVEVAARGVGDPAGARAQLDRLVDVAAEFAQGAELTTLGGFLDYLAAADTAERGLDLGEVEARTDCVQLLTVHAAKGLEWDAVFVPGLVPGRFPALRSAAPGGWTTDRDALPYPLRGDAEQLPDFDLSRAENQMDVEQARQDFRAAVGARELLEERRLAYVAVTRARELLVCSGYWWDERSKPAGPTAFLTEIRDACLTGAGEVAEWAEQPPPDTPNPTTLEPARVTWPVDPIAARRDRIEAAALAVTQASGRVATGVSESAVAEDAQLMFEADEGNGAVEPADADAAGESGVSDVTGVAGVTGVIDVSDVTAASFVPTIAEHELLEAWERDIPLLLSERRRRAPRTTIEVTLPEHLSVSQLVVLRADQSELARRIRRPMPFAPAPSARRGTAFHAWLEQRFGGERLLDTEELPGAGDTDAAADSDLLALQAAFERGEWAERTPVEVEVPFDVQVAGIPVRGRMDAVFRDADGGYDVVDWKTGRIPTGADADAAAVQLAVYRRAWSELSGAPLEKVRAGFHYVRHDHTRRPVDLLDAAGLDALIREIPPA